MLRNQCRYILFNAAFGVLIFVSAVSAQGLPIGGQEVYIHGINVPWRYYGEDFGGSGRRAYDPEFYDRLFARLSDSGLNTIRFWIHCDGRSSPQRSSDNSMRALSPQFLRDIGRFIDQAASHDLMVLPVLWTFEMVDGRLHELLTNADFRQSYLDQALTPLLLHLRDRCNILAWEVINEPEWAMDIPFAGTTRRTVSAGEMQRFIGEVANRVHELTDHWVTVGSAGLRFSTNAFLGAKNFWHDLAFRDAGVHCSGPVLDFYSVHYYRCNFENLSPFRHNVSMLDLDKPVLLSEFGLLEESTITLLDKALINGYAGTMPWSMMANDAEGSWKDYEHALVQFASEKADLLRIEDPCAPATDFAGSCLIFPNPTDREVTITSGVATSQRAQLYNAFGQLVLESEIAMTPKFSIDVQSLSSGTYLLVVQHKRLGTWQEHSRQLLQIVH